MAPKAKEKSKPAAAAAASSVAVEDLFTSLNRHIQRSEFDLAVKVSDQGMLDWLTCCAIKSIHSYGCSEIVHFDDCCLVMLLGF